MSQSDPEWGANYKQDEERIRAEFYAQSVAAVSNRSEYLDVTGGNPHVRPTRRTAVLDTTDAQSGLWPCDVQDRVIEVIDLEGKGERPMNTGPSKHFSWDEVERSFTADMHGIDNRLANRANQVTLLGHVRVLADFLESLRTKVGPITIHSWWRSFELNEIIYGGSDTSLHRRGLAADVSVSFHKPFTVGAEAFALALDNNLKVEIIAYRGFCHVAIQIDQGKDSELRVNGLPQNFVTEPGDFSAEWTKLHYGV